MPKVSIIKNSFTGGEFGSSLMGRTDIAQYQYACEVAENILVRPYGSVISTPGTTYVSEVKDSSKRTRLIPFVFNRSDAYIIEMGESYFRFYTDQGVVISTGTTAYEVAHTYTESELFDVQFAQQNDIIYFAHPNHAPQRLIRYGVTSWTLSDFAYIGGPFLDLNTTALTMTPSATAGSITVSLSATNSTTYFVVSSGTTKGHVGSYWQIGTTPSAGYVKFTAVTNVTTATATVVNRLTGTAATANWAEGAWSAVKGYPGSVTFHENRLFYARTSSEPAKVWGSKTYTYDDFQVGAIDDDALNLPLVSNESNAINWLTSGPVLVAGTYGGEFVIENPSGGPLTPSATTAKRSTSWGSEKILPAKIGSYFYYIQRFGQKVRELFYNWDTDSYKSIDKTIFSPHILGQGVIDMAFQQNPETILWITRTDGTLATFTREIDQEIQAWTRQTTDGLYESVACVPSEAGAYDEVWVVVNRTINGSTKRYIELFDNIIPPDRQDMANYLHSSLRYNAYDTTSSSSASISLSATSGSITITSSTAYFVANDVGQRIRCIDSDGVTVGEATVTSQGSTTLIVAYASYPFSVTAYSAGSWGVSVEELSGLTHLEAEEVNVLADGGLDTDTVKTVSDGTISLDYNYFVVNVGLPYTQKLVTVPFEAGSSRGTAQGKVQKINEVSFKVNKSHKGFYVGGSEAFLERLEYRNPTTLLGTPETIYTGIISGLFNDDYQTGSRIYVYNYDPLPMEILSIQAELTTYDK
jgi:hypothetical protein